MGICGTDRQIATIAFNVSDIANLNGFERAVWTAQG